MRSLGLFTVVLLALGCAPTLRNGPTVTPAADHFTLNGNQAVLENGVLMGNGVSVSKTEGNYRGFYRGSTVDLRVRGNEIEGSIGGRTELYVSEGPNGSYRIRGMFAGDLSDLEITNDHIVGNLGSEGYELYRRANSRWYVSYQSPFYYYDLALPADFNTRPVGERALFLTLFLGSNSKLQSPNEPAGLLSMAR